VANLNSLRRQQFIPSLTHHRFPGRSPHAPPQRESQPLLHPLGGLGRGNQSARPVRQRSAPQTSAMCCSRSRGLAICSAMRFLAASSIWANLRPIGESVCLSWEPESCWISASVKPMARRLPTASTHHDAASSNSREVPGATPCRVDEPQVVILAEHYYWDVGPARPAADGHHSRPTASDFDVLPPPAAISAAMICSSVGRSRRHDG